MLLLPHFFGLASSHYEQVYDILLQYVETQSWATALQAVMPSRKMEHGGPGGRKGRRGKDGELEGEEGGEDGEELEGEAVYQVKSGNEMEVEVKGEGETEKEKEQIVEAAEALKTEA